MPLGLVAFLGWILFVTLSALALFIWGWRTGQFKDINKSTFTMLEEREPEAWPGRKEDNK
jgi:nitrogen fixation-related uncharacterized protein